MVQESLAHKDKKDSTVKWFIFMLVPILNFYWLWKVAEMISGHEKYILKGYEALRHMDRKESTGKWFVIFLVPAILGFIAVFTGVASSFFGGIALGVSIFIVLFIIALVVGIYVLYEMAIINSGHEKVYRKYEAVEHKEKKDSTAKWFVFGIVPILNLYFGWQMSEVISGHEKVFK
jgi:hypothetical protein